MEKIKNFGLIRIIYKLIEIIFISTLIIISIPGVITLFQFINNELSFDSEKMLSALQYIASTWIVISFIIAVITKSKNNSSNLSMRFLAALMLTLLLGFGTINIGFYIVWIVLGYMAIILLIKYRNFFYKREVVINTSTTKVK